MATTRRVFGVLSLGGSLAAIAALGGCEAAGLEMKPGATSVLQAFAPPSPADAAKWAVDPFDADKRYRGTLLLANAPFAGEPVYVQLFVDNSKDTDPGVRSAATRGLGSHGGPEHGPLLVDRLNDEDPSVRTEAARALQRVHYKPAIPAIMAKAEMEKELEPQVRMEAASALGQYPENRVVEQLIRCLADENLGVNRNAQSSLRTLTGQDFGIDRSMWLSWYSSNQNLFAARSVYIYPVFNRGKTWWEHIPFVPGPPNEAAGTPVGMMPGTVE